MSVVATTSAQAPTAVKFVIVPLESEVVERFGIGLKVRVETNLDEVVFTVAADDYRALCERVYRAGFEVPQCLSGTDMDWGLGVTLHVQSLETKQKIVIRTYVPYDAPKVPTVCDLWGGVEWHEREAYDLVGVTFSDHPDHRRILLEDDWTIHPLQRRYDTRGYLMRDWVAKSWPNPQPWEEGYAAFAVAPVVAKVVVAVPAVSAAAVVVEIPKVIATETPSETVVTEITPLQTDVVSVAAPEPLKERKKWVPKGEATTPVVPAQSAAVKAEISEEATEASVHPKVKRWEPKS